MEIQNNRELLKAVQSLERKYEKLDKRENSKNLLDNVPSDDPVLIACREYWKKTDQKNKNRRGGREPTKVYFAFDKDSQLICKETSVRRLSHAMKAHGYHKGIGENGLRAAINGNGNTKFGSVTVMLKKKYERLISNGMHM